MSPSTRRWPSASAASYDLYSVLLHETGHSLGLEHPDNPDAVMLATYNGVKAGLDAGDIAGLQGALRREDR